MLPSEQKGDDKRVVVLGSVTPSGPVVLEKKPTLSQQLATLCQHLRDEIVKWEHPNGGKVLGLPASSNGESTSSHTPIVVKQNQWGLETEMGSPPGLPAVGYARLKTASDMSGELYEVKMVALLFLRAVNGARRFYLGANMDAAGQFDDLILRLQLSDRTGWSTHFVQLKHKTKAKVTQGALLSLSKNDFGIVKYCHSYLGVKSKMKESTDLQFCGPFEEINFVIYTNAYVDKDLEKPDRKSVSDPGTRFVSTSSGPRSVMFRLDPLLDGVIYQSLEEITEFKSLLVELQRCFKLDQDGVSGVLGSLNAFVVSRHSINGELVRIVERLKQDPSEETVASVLGKELSTVASFPCYREFVERLQIFTGQANVKELDALITHEIARALTVSDAAALHRLLVQVTNDVQAWWQDASYFLTEDAAFWYNILLAHVEELSSGTVADLRDSGLRFNESTLETARRLVWNRGVTNVRTRDGSSFLSMLKVYQAVGGRCCLFVGLETLVGRRQEVMCAWQKPRCRRLVIHCAEGTNVTIPRRLHADLYAILKDTTDLGLILVSDSDNRFADALKETLFVEESDAVNQWSQLCSTSQSTLLQRNVSFQGQMVSFSSLAGDDDRLTNQLKGNALMQLLKSELEVGPPLDNPVDYYVSRRLVGGGSGPFCVESASDVNQRVVLVVAEPGMGKSTLFAHLAVATKRLRPTKWVVRIDLNDCTTYLAGLKSVTIEEMESVGFLVKNVRSAGGVLEDMLFKHGLQAAGNVVVMVDSVDEVCPLYETQVCFLLKHLLDTGIGSLWVTSRTTLKETLEKTLNTCSFSLLPFTRDDQEDFLCRYWKSKVVDDDIEATLNDEKKLREYAVQVINLASDMFTGDDLAISIPQQTLMLAELFEAEFVRYCRGVGGRLPKRLDVVSLYDSFVQNKFEVYVYEKKRVSRDNAAVAAENAETYEAFRRNHTAASLVLLLTADELGALPTFADARAFLRTFREGREKSGILVGVVDGMPRFVHRTFAEYFAATFFANDPTSVRDFLERNLFGERFAVVRNFFDRLLARDCPLHLAVLDRDVETMQEVLEGGMDVDGRDAGGRTPLHLAAGGRECVSFLLGQGAGVNVEDTLFGWRPLRYADQVRAWTSAGMILREGGVPEDLVEVRGRMAAEVFEEFVKHLLGGESSSDRLLLVASRHGDLETVEYSVKVCGADVGVARGAMQRAAEGGHLSVMSFLAERGGSYVATDPEGNVPLHSAVRHNQRAAVEFLLDWGVPVNVLDGAGRSPLTLASELGATEVVGRLVAQGADVNFRAVDGQTPVLCAADHGWVDTVQLLLASGADVSSTETNDAALLCVPFVQHEWDLAYLAGQLIENGTCVDYRNKAGRSALHYATLCGKYELATRLIEKGADVNLGDDEGNRPLHCVALGGCDDRVALMQLLLRSGANVNLCTSDGSSFRQMATRRGLDDVVGYFTPLDRELASVLGSGDAGVIRGLVGGGACVDPGSGDVRRLLTDAVGRGDLALVRLLLEGGADMDTVDTAGKSLIVSAALGDRWEVVRYLAATGADCRAADRDGRSVLHISLKNAEVVRLLCRNGADVNAPDLQGTPPLLAAVQAGLLEVAQVLVEQGANVNVVDAAGRSLVHLACDSLDVDLMRLLADNACDVSSGDLCGLLPLMSAARSKSLELVEMIVGREADVNTGDSGGVTALHVAASHTCNLDVVEFLVNHGADVNKLSLLDESPLMCAANGAAWDSLEYLVRCGADVNAQDRHGRTSLNMAVGDVDSVKLLVANGAQVNGAAGGRAPLLCAVFQQQWESAEFLVGAGADVNVADVFGLSAYHLASELGNVGMMWMLAERGAKVDTRNNEGKSPLMCAMLTSSWEAARASIQLGADLCEVDGSGRSLFHMAVDAGQHDMMRCLLEEGLDVHTRDERGWTPLMSAVRDASFRAAMFLLDRGVAVEAKDSTGRSALHVACEKRDHDMLKFLIARGLRQSVYHASVWKTLVLSAAKIDAWDIVALCLDSANLVRHTRPGESPLFWAIRTGIPEFVNFVSTHEAEFADIGQSAEAGLPDSVADNETEPARANPLDYDARVPLFTAARGGHLDLMNYLKETGADFTIRDGRSRTVLFEACSSGKLCVVKLLLKYGADPNAFDEHGRTPLFDAAVLGRTEIVSYLVDCGADVNARDNDGTSPIFEAATWDRLEVVRSLVGLGANVNMVDARGRSCLFNAVSWGRLDVLEYLVEHGGDPTLRDADDTSILTLAAVAGSTLAVETIIRLGVDPDLEDKEGRSSLFHAANFSALDSVRCLIENGADPDHRDREGRTALFAVASAGLLPSVQCLIENGVDPNLRDNAGRTAVFLAANVDSAAVVGYLLDHGAEAGLRDNEGRTALFGAAAVQAVDAMRCLIYHGADPGVVDEQGYSALSLSRHSTLESLGLDPQLGIKP